MDMYQKRNKRRETKDQREEENMSKDVAINWFPGHMAKTKRKIKENIKLIDVVIEVIDARLPLSSKIKDIDDIIRTKKHVIVMTKKDLCDMKVTRKWVEHYELKGASVVLLDLTNNKDYKEVYEAVEKQTKELIEKRVEKGISNKEIRALVVGVPNAGKSTLINALAGKKVANTGNKPGVTKQVNWLKTNNNLLLLDTPGILWPKIDDKKVAINLASLTAIKSDVINITDIANHIITYLVEYYPSILETRYKVNKEQDLLEIYEVIGKNIGATKSGEVDYEKVAYKVYNDLASGKISGVTFDTWK
ncbi:MAG: ribosome biogenesis GTPase YlqF [bacterium]